MSGYRQAPTSTWCMTDLSSLGREDLIEITTTRQRMIEHQQKQIEELREEIEQLRCGGKRQRRHSPKGSELRIPNHPARKPDQVPFSHRAAPVEEAPETITVPAPVWRRPTHDTSPRAGCCKAKDVQGRLPARRAI